MFKITEIGSEEKASEGGWKVLMGSPVHSEEFHSISFSNSSLREMDGCKMVQKQIKTHFRHEHLNLEPSAMVDRVPMGSVK